MALWAEQSDELAMIEKILTRMGCRIYGVESAEQLKRLDENTTVDLIVAALSQSFQSPLALLSERRPGTAHPPFLVVSDCLDVNLYVEAIQRGAFDGVALPLNEEELIRIVTRALEAYQLRPCCCGAAGECR